MNFSQFAKIMYPFCGAGMSEADFIIALTNNIMESSGEKDNPLNNLTPDFRKRIYEGTRSISKKSASAILNRLDKIRFEAYLDALTEDARKSITKSLDKYDNQFSTANVIFQCAEIFESILINITSGVLSQRTGYGTNIPGIPMNNLPHTKNPYFTGREEKLKAISDNFMSKEIIALTQSVTGLGGVGKTSIALEHAYRNFNKYETIWWVNAETEQTALDSIREFCLKKKILPDDASASEIIEALKYWFNNIKNKNWLFIYDNVDAEHFNMWFEKYLPQTGNGHVLITTRSYFFPKSATINIDIFNDSEAVSFLKKRTGKFGDGFSDELAKVLAERLQCLPLAMEQAAAFIEQTPGVTYQDYINLIDKYGVDVFLQKNYIVDYSSSVAITWRISMEKINRDSAVQMFNMCAYFAPTKIPVDLFIRGKEELPIALKTDISDDLARNDIIRDLTRYSLLSCENDNTVQSDENRVFYMHRLLQEVVQRSFGKNTEWLGYALALVDNAIDWANGDKKSVEAFKIESQHAILIAEKSAIVFARDEERLDQVVWICNEAGLVCIDLGEPDRALEYFHKALIICDNIYGDNDSDTATTNNNIGLAYTDLNEPKKALKYYNKALSIYYRVFNNEREQPEIASTYNNIGGVYNALGKPEKALNYYNKALSIREKILGKEHRSTAMTYNNIGAIYKILGKPIEALKFYEKDMIICEKEYGLEHPQTATAYNNIGGAFVDTGESKKALYYYNKALAIRIKVYGEEHPSIAASYNNIGFVYANADKPKRALAFYRKALKIKEKLFGSEHPDTAISYNNIGGAYDDLEIYERALHFYQKALAIHEKIYGIKHPDTAMSYNNIGSAYRAMKKPETGLKFYKKASVIWEKAYGYEHPHTAISYNNIGGTYADLGEHKKAIEYYDKALTIDLKIHGAEHPFIAVIYNNMGIAYDNLENTNKALAIWEKCYGSEHPHTKAVRESILSLTK